MDKVNLSEKLALFCDHWHPRIVGELNGQHVKLAKLLGEFIWHRHDNEDELFLVVEASLYGLNYPGQHVPLLSPAGFHYGPYQAYAVGEMRRRGPEQA